MAGLFQVLWGKEEGFGKAEALKGTDKKPLRIPVADERAQVTRAICTRPTAVDWDGDGNLDLVVGNFEGSFYLFRGKGEGGFEPEPERMKCEEEDLKVEGAHSDPYVVDWDGDGDLDILSGSSQGGVQWAENIAGKEESPKLKPFRSLIAAPADELSSGEKPAGSTRVWVDDVNGDGKLDVLVGDDATLTYPAEGLTEEEMENKKKEWQKEMNAVMKELREQRPEDGRPSQEIMSKYRKLHQSRSEFMTEESTGFVWLYLQK